MSSSETYSGTDASGRVSDENLSHRGDNIVSTPKEDDVGTVVEVDDAIVLLLGAPSENAFNPAQIEGITRLEKLLFLLEKESGVSGLLTEDPEFKSHHFGPFSVKVYHAVDVLAAAGLVADSAAVSSSTEDTWESDVVLGIDPDPYATRDISLTPLGRRYYDSLMEDLPSGTESELQQLKDRFVSLPLRQLVRYVYKRYPDFTDKSKIRASVLSE